MKILRRDRLQTLREVQSKFYQETESFLQKPLRAEPDEQSEEKFIFSDTNPALCVVPSEATLLAFTSGEEMTVRDWGAGGSNV